MASSETPKCKYWDKCFRTDIVHLAKFDHPPKEDKSEKKSDTKSGSIELEGRNIVFAGLLKTPRQKAIARAKLFGCHVTANLSKETDIVVKGESPGKIAKTASETGIKCFTEEEWEEILSTSDKATSETNGTAEKGTGSKTTETSPPKLRRGRTHDMSEEEDTDVEIDKPKITKRKSTESVPDKSDTPSPSKKGKTTAASNRPRCKYWDKCYRKELNHLSQFSHPSDVTDDAVASTSGSDETRTRLQKRNSLLGKTKPLNEMKDGETVEMSGCRIKRTGETYYCTCVGWKMQNKAIDKRTCRHLKSHLGDDFELVRCGEPQKSKPSHAPRHKSVSVLLANKWDESKDPKNWWMSEKLDGVRAYWDGKCFYSRLGNAFIAPHWFIKDFPSDMTLDGELFGGRKKFQSTVSIVKTDGADTWGKIRYEVFDAPGIGDKPFEKRLEHLKELFDKYPPKFAKLVEQTKCRGKEHVAEEMKKILGIGGEGLMLREPGSKYEKKRSHTLLKVKKFYDAEAIVIGHEASKSLPGMVGALRCRMACGKEFSVGSGVASLCMIGTLRYRIECANELSLDTRLTMKDRRNPPKKGSIITYKFQEYTNSGSPRFPTYIGIRIDADKPKDAEMPEINLDG